MYQIQDCRGLQKEAKKEERKKSLTRGHVEDIGSTAGIQSYAKDIVICRCMYI